MFKLKSKYFPTWDQPKAINSIIKYLQDWNKYQTLWWVTWSWKTFVMANIINKIQKPTLIIAHNKTLAAQLALEFKDFFPDNAIHYFVSYYDYYQPEVYIRKTNTYIEKEVTINEEINRLRHAATQDLIKRKDVIIVASVSCIYWIWNIEVYEDSIFEINVWNEYQFNDLIKKLILLQYKRVWNDFKPWTFQIKWDLIEIFPSSFETIYSIEFLWNKVSNIIRKNYLTWEIYETLNKIEIFPAKHVIITKDIINRIIPEIQKELKERLEFFKQTWEMVKYERLKTKIEYDIEMIQETGYVNWIENYSKYIDWRQSWIPPTTLIDYFWNDFLCFIDESHITINQISWMYTWDKTRKENLVWAWFRLPSTFDNRPLKFDEFESKIKSMVLVSATPWEYDIIRSSKNPEKFFNFNTIIDWDWIDDDNNRIVPLVIRPTWLLDPIIELKSIDNMINDIIKNIYEIVKFWEKMLIITLTKKSSEELTNFLSKNWVKVKYIHSEIETLDRIDILNDLRTWKIDVIVWINLLKEGLDLPEITKIVILDANKQWFLRSSSSLIQIIWRAARNLKWKVYMYSEKLKNIRIENEKLITQEWTELLIEDFLLNENWEKISLFKFDKWKYLTKEWIFVSNAMKIAINLTNYRRKLQHEYNQKNWIIPTTVFSKIKKILIKTKN